VLVVDDEPAVRLTLAAQLEAAGCSALSAADGADAMALLDRGEAVDLLITDLSMPGMDGLALIRAAQQSRPGLPAVLLTGCFSGHCAGPVPGESANGPFVLLRKPVPVGELVELAATLLERDLIP